MHLCVGQAVQSKGALRQTDTEHTAGGCCQPARRRKGVTILFPHGWPWSQARLPWGGFIGMALVVSDGFREVE